MGKNKIYLNDLGSSGIYKGCRTLRIKLDKEEWEAAKSSCVSKFEAIMMTGGPFKQRIDDVLLSAYMDGTYKARYVVNYGPAFFDVLDDNDCPRLVYITPFTR